MDSGVETGNDSNDSSANQHENIILMNFIGTCNNKPIIRINNASSSVSVANENSSIDSLSDKAMSTENVNNDSVDDKSPVNQNLQSTPNNSLVSVSTFNSGLVFPLTDRAKIWDIKIPSRFWPSGGDFPTPRDFVQQTICKSSKSKSARWQRLRCIEMNVTNCKDERRMRLAAATNNVEVMQRLLEAGISPNNSDEQGRSPLHLASCRGFTEMVSLLLRYGADPNRKDSIGNTPLHLAAVTSKMSVVTLLLMAGTDVLSLDSHGHNPLQLAQTKLRVLQNCARDDSDMNKIKDEVRNVISMLMAYLQKQKDTQDQVEALSSFCSRLSLSNTSDQVQDDVRDLLANINSLKLTN
ncbi:ankyrin repeat domain-containing protein 54-like isoform X2 [Phymastichus coffea]|uniref:ankyrin repeat domain-containing protein 54-like isoform X2 n=1 Tax=Phymastichus coffea TaxID=108790 RepID=UPI00273C7A0F|nr:ankyrin repeat domain-containing protein 54-like isoform X2 [Phymastichus coffea]